MYLRVACCFGVFFCDCLFFSLVVVSLVWMVGLFDCVWLTIAGYHLFNGVVNFFGYGCCIYCDLFDVDVCLGFLGIVLLCLFVGCLVDCLH